MMNLVNGYVCANCTDVELARRGVDPAHPQRGVHTAKRAAEDDKDAHPGGAVREDERTRERLGENRPVDSGAVGTNVNLLG